MAITETAWSMWLFPNDEQAFGVTVFACVWPVMLRLSMRTVVPAAQTTPFPLLADTLSVRFRTAGLRAAEKPANVLLAATLLLTEAVTEPFAWKPALLNSIRTLSSEAFTMAPPVGSMRMPAPVFWPLLRTIVSLMRTGVVAAAVV